MLPFRVVYSDRYHLPLGHHVFPGEKYRHVYERLRQDGVITAEDVLAPHPADDRDVLLVHGNEWVYKLQTGTLSAREELQLEIPYSEELVEAFWLAAGGSILAARQALADGVCISLGGGFHHAFPDHGEGFCMIHDVAIAIRRLQRDQQVRRAMVLDCDVHQANGTAVIFGRRAVAAAAQAGELPPQPRLTRSAHGSMRESPVDGMTDVFTISLHQENNYPLWKPPSSIDVNLPDGLDDAKYLLWLEEALGRGLAQFQPELMAYVAGADPYRDDQLGGLGLTIEGLKQRDLFVFRTCRERGIPVFVTLAGGYAFKEEDTVTIHANTVIAAKEVFGG